MILMQYSWAEKTNKHDHFRDEAEKGLLLTRRAPDGSAVRSSSIEDRMGSSFWRKPARRGKMSKAPTGMGHQHNKEQQHPHRQWPTSIAPVTGVLPLLEEWRHNATQELTHKCSHHVFLPTTTSRCNKKHTNGRSQQRLHTRLYQHRCLLQNKKFNSILNQTKIDIL